jgi:toxin CptA
MPLTEFLVLAALLIFVMGFAVQRGGTCLVAAVTDAVRGRGARLVWLAEAAVWAAALLYLAQLAGVGMTAPAPRPVTGGVVAGGVLLGLGAWANSGCVFGTIARLGNGELRMAATLAGLAAGAFLLPWLPGRPAPLPAAPEVFVPGAAMVAALGALLALRAAQALVRSWPGSARDLLRAVQQPWPATVVIGVTFAGSWILIGTTWTYLDLLNQLPQGMIEGAEWRLVLFAALAGGALAGGLTDGQFALRWPAPGTAAASFAGGVALTLGAALVPSHNDVLIFLGLPFVLPHALVGLAAMMVTIAALVVLKDRLAGQGRPESV